MSGGQEGPNPLQEAVVDANVLQFGQESSMGDSVECLAEIQDYHICLTLIIKCFSKIIYEACKLCIARSTLAKTMLTVGEYMMLIKVVHDMMMDDVL